MKVVLVGAGNRGATYTDFMAEMPEKYEVVAVAEPIESRRNHIRDRHKIPEELCFHDYRDLFAQGKIADLAIIATQDSEHFEPAMKAISLNYDVMLEKPISPSEKECCDLAEYAKKQNVHVIVCHVLRYSPIFQLLKSKIDDGTIGDIISIDHEECVGHVHQSHSFVRGNWGNTQRSSMMLLAKSCHDMDILQWLIGKKCRKLHSFGALTYFNRKHMPDGAPEYCIEGCPVGESCPYNAVKLYLDDKENDWFRTTCTRQDQPTDEMVEKVIRTTQYGKCVYQCDNDVVDHQTVHMLFEDDVTVTFTMSAFTEGGRFIHIMGTKGEIRATLDGVTPVRIFDFVTRKWTEIPVSGADGVQGGHGGGDLGIVSTVYEYLCGDYEGNSVSDIEVSCENHQLAFAAEYSRLNGCVVDFEEYLTKEHR